MAAPAWKWDPTAEASGAELVLTTAPYWLLEQSFPMPDLDTAFASSVDATRDTLTGLRYRNRKVHLRVRVVGASDGALESALADLTMKAAKCNRDAIVTGTGRGGTLAYTSPSGDTVTFDIVSAQVFPDTGQRYVKRSATEVTLEFECLPFARGTENTPGDHVETSLPVLVFTESSVAGDVPALGRLVVDDDQGKNQLAAIYGLRSKNYSAAATAGLFWQAEALTPVAAGAATAAGPTGASGSGSNTILANALTTDYQDILKSTVSTTYWTHVGAYRVIARVQGVSGNTGTVSVRASCAQADVTNYTQGPAAQLPAAGAWCLADLGVVSIPEVLAGTQRWELRVQACSTVAGDGVYADYVWLVPVDECSGVAQVSSPDGVAAYTVNDTFDQSAGNLNGKTPAPLSAGNWVESSAGKFTIDATNHVAQRTGTSDSAGLNNGAFAAASASVTGQIGRVDLAVTATPGSTLSAGLLLRYTDASNWVAATISQGLNGFRIYKCVAGTVTKIAQDSSFRHVLMNGHTFTIIASVTSDGALQAVFFQDGTGLCTLTVNDDALATGGALASGKVGLFDHYTSGTACTRRFDNFLAGTVTSDAACFASQSIQIRHDGVLRSTASGIWTRPSRFDGDYLLVPASGKESRPVEVTAKMSRARLGEAGDSGIDDVSAKLYVTPRYLQLPA